MGSAGLGMNTLAQPVNTSLLWDHAEAARQKNPTNVTQNKNKIKKKKISTYMMMVFLGTLVSCSVTTKRTV